MKNIFLSIVVCALIAAAYTEPIRGKINRKSKSVSLYLTKGDKTVLFEKQNGPLLFKKSKSFLPVIDVNDSESFQTIDGFGYTLTGGSAMLINRLSAQKKYKLLKQLFLWNDDNIGVSYLRISIGASDLSDTTFTYDDVPAEQTDTALRQFTIGREKKDLVPVLKEILALNPAIKILGSPWSAPAWMKTNKALKGGSLDPKYYHAYAAYFVKYVRAMQQEGIRIDAITIQNEPLHGGNNPSMVMQAGEQAVFISKYLGPAFRAAGIDTKIIAWDHNCDNPGYPIAVLNDTSAKKFADGSAFHLYNGSITALTEVHKVHPDKNIYFTEQWVGGPGNFGGDLAWHIENVIIGSMRNWSRNALEWNLAADANYQPHTQGGCTTCLGALTIDDSVSRNVAYYIIAHASKFVRPGSVRIESNHIAGLPNVAFKNPAGQKVLIVLNKNKQAASFHIRFRGEIITTRLDAGAVATYVW